MRIGCDLTALTKPRAGIRVYVEQLVDALATCPDLALVGYWPGGTPPRLPAGLLVRQGQEPTRHFPLLWMQCEGMRRAMADRLDVFWSGLYTVPRVLVGRVPIVITVHDVMWKVMPETMRWRTRLASLARARFAIESADRIVAVSRATADDVLRYYDIDPKKIEVVYSGVNSTYRPGDPEEGRHMARRYGVEGRYALFVGTVEPRKNLARVLRAWNVPLELVVVGAKGWKSATVYGHPRARFLGYVPDEHLRWLYVGAEFLLFPSLYEGFGLPVLEALACGCPVLTSRVSSLPEVAGDAAVYVDPEGEEGIADAILRLTEDGSLRESLRRAGLERASEFSWSRTAEGYVEAFRKVVLDPPPTLR